MSDAQPTAVEKVSPMPFAIMRNTHEALRASIGTMQAQLDAGDVEELRAEWQAFGRALLVHMVMEDRDMFPLLDEVGAGAVSAAGLPAEHLEDTRLAAAVAAALRVEVVDWPVLRAAFAAWKASHLHHLEHEEQVMMPLTVKTAPTPEGRARIVHDRLVSTGEQLPDFDWFVGWVVHKLSDHGSAEQPPAVAVRVFAWGLQHACSAAQWQRLAPIVKDNCAAPIWQEMVEKFRIDGPGPI